MNDKTIRHLQLGTNRNLRDSQCGRPARTPPQNLTSSEGTDSHDDLARTHHPGASTSGPDPDSTKTPAFLGVPREDGGLSVEPTGLEPVTPCLQSRCATNCAMAPMQLSQRSTDLSRS